MKEKKGFTFVELLAVIALPQIISVIESSRKGTEYIKALYDNENCE